MPISRTYRPRQFKDVTGQKHITETLRKEADSGILGHAFLFSGPAINILAIVLTAQVLGYDIGLARAVSAIVMAIVIGLLMAFIFRKDEIKS